MAVILVLFLFVTKCLYRSPETDNDLKPIPTFVGLQSCPNAMETNIWSTQKNQNLQNVYVAGLGKQGYCCFLYQLVGFSQTLGSVTVEYKAGVDRLKLDPMRMILHDSFSLPFFFIFFRQYNRSSLLQKTIN